MALIASLYNYNALAQVMTIHHKDGTTQRIQAAQIEKITFGDTELPTLDNQYGYDEDVIDLLSAFYCEDDELGQVFAFYDKAEPDDETDVPVIAFAMPEDSLGKTIDLATADLTSVLIVQKDTYYKQLSGTLRIAFDKFKKNITVAFDSQTPTGHYVRTAYQGAFTITYDTDDTYTVTATDGTSEDYNMTSVLRVLPTATGEATAFAFGNVEATTAEGLKSGSNAVWFTVSASKVGTTIDLAADTDSYTFRFFDYTTGTTYDQVVSGTLTTAQTDGDEVYFEFTATLADGTVISGDYYGPVTDVESLDDMIPAQEYGNVIIYYNADGEETVNQTIGSATASTKTDSSYNVDVTTITFAPEDSSQKAAKLSFTEGMVNQGTLNLVDLAEGSMFKIEYGSIQLTSRDDKKYYGYSLYPDNGTVEITRNEDGTYKIFLEVVNSYTTTSWSGTATGGDNTKLIVSYTGTVTE